MNRLAHFGKWLKEWRRSLRITQEELASGVNCSVKTIEKIESGDRRPSKQLAELLARHLHIPPEESQLFVQFARGGQFDRHPTDLGAADSLIEPSWLLDYQAYRCPNNLPAQLNSFIGRSGEVDSAIALLRRAGVRLLVCTGPPGIGKTRFGLQIASSALDRLDGCEDGVYFVSLAAVSDPGLVPSAIAQAMGVKESADQPLADSLAQYLQHKGMLLLLDNFEHLAQAAPVLSHLLTSCLHLKVLVTSRQVLHLYGEHDIWVPPLSLPDTPLDSEERHDPETLLKYEAIQLFVERALAARTDFRLTQDNAPSVARLCARLEGLPLAIELAAARTRYHSVESLVEHLEESLLSLAERASNLPDRHHTIRGAIAWSYDLLDTQEKALFRRVSVFVGGFTLDAAYAVSLHTHGDAPPTGPINREHLPDKLAALVDKNLLQLRTQGGTREEQERYWMLEAVREYGLEQLAANTETCEEELTFRRYADFYLELAEKSDANLRGPEQAMWLRRLEFEHANLRATLRWLEKSGATEQALRMAGGLARFWFMRNHYEEARQELTRALSLPRTGKGSLAEAEALLGLGFFLKQGGDLPSARSMYEQAMAVYQELSDNPGVATTLHRLGTIAADQGDYTQARSLYTESLSLFSDLGDNWRCGVLYNELGRLAHRQGDYATSITLREKGLSLFRELDDQRQIASALTGFGSTLLALHRAVEARATLEESLAMFEQLEDEGSIVSVLTNLADVERYLEEYDAAYSHSETALEIARRQGSKTRMVPPLYNIGMIALHLGDYQKARASFTEALIYGQATELKYHTCITLSGVAALAAKQGDQQKAARLIGSVERQLETSGQHLDVPDVEPYEKAKYLVRAQLGEAAFAGAESEGRMMTVEAAVACALGLLGQP
ncbi:MAG TPA: tetratricopeptide repeat protein [Chloroflexia bacterium]|nr:tetratricopeptide repeat protein [Chloroflexia bacterium]